MKATGNKNAYAVAVTVAMPKWWAALCALGSVVCAIGGFTQWQPALLVGLAVLLFVLGVHAGVRHGARVAAKQMVRNRP